MGNWADATQHRHEHPPLTHCEVLGHPSQSWMRTRKAECGSYVAVTQFAYHIDQVTCPTCRAVIEAREAVQL